MKAEHSPEGWRYTTQISQWVVSTPHANLDQQSRRFDHRAVDQSLQVRERAIPLPASKIRQRRIFK